MTAALFALVASVGWGTADFLAGRASRRSPAVTVLAVSQVVGIVATAIAVVAIRPAAPTGALILFASLAGAALALGLGCLYQGMSVGRISLVAPISATAATVPVIWGIAGGDVISSQQAVALTVTLLGVVLASAERSSTGEGRMAAGVSFALVAALAGGVHVVLLDAASDHGVLWTLFVQRCATGLVAGCVLAARGSTLPSTLEGLQPLVVIGMLDVIATGSFAFATTRGQLSVVATVGALYPVLTVLLARQVLGERLPLLQRLGIISALAGVAVLVATAPD
jgi:drug/metabolite transporter (DMT)-like permease